MMRGIVPALEKHHNVRILHDGMAAAVRLSHRYLPDRQLPDKAVSVLDTACARLSLGQNATPAAIEDARRSWPTSTSSSACCCAKSLSAPTTPNDSPRSRRRARRCSSV
jgi:ATP-dependent Clp protease ATP-binding subunit ClpA